MFVILIVILLVCCAWYFSGSGWDYGYWRRRGVKHPKPVVFFGNAYKQITVQISLSEQIAEWSKQFPDEPYVGIYLINKLALVLRDPELIKHVLSTDFRYFHERGVHPHKHVKEPLFQNLFTADGDVWKLMRQHLTPAFSSGKLKAMFPLIAKTAEKMLSVTEPGNQDVRELMARYTTDFIGTCGFGLDFDSLNDEHSVFRRLGKRIFALTNRDAFVSLLKQTAPELFKGLHFFASEIEDNTMSLVKEILMKRNYMPSGRNDFIDLLLEVKEKGTIVGQSVEHFEADGTPKSVQLELDDVMIAAQVFIFFAAGFETSSSASSFLLHELAYNPEVQERCQREVDEVLTRHGGRISYEAVKELKYLGQALKETLRLYPSPGFLMRRSVGKYTFPGTDLTIDDNIVIFISLDALHKDPRFFEDPDTFRPERFDADKINDLPKHVFMPFGSGPRSCIGERLGVLQSLAGICAILSKFTVRPAPTTRRHPLIDPRSIFVQNVLGNLPLSLQPRKTVF